MSSENKIKASKPVNILDMVDDKAEKEKVLFYKTCQAMKSMSDGGCEKYEIESMIKQVKLPFGIHMAVMARFSEICKYGRPLTKAERKLFNS